MKQKLAGYTLVEMLVVVVVFAVIGLISSETIILTLRGTAKADAISKVRNNLDFAVGAMERQIRGAKLIQSCSNLSMTIVDQNDSLVTFACISPNVNHLPSYIASSSASLTSSNITISSCSFTCTQATSTTPAQVTISVTGQDRQSQNAPVSVTTQITLRTY
jgi:prepilin-type N-terminal cleavage/methylation domain-containing protein